MTDERRQLDPYAPPAADVEPQTPPEVARRFVVYRYALSMFFFTYYGASEPIAVVPGRSGWLRGLPYSLLSVLFGWWGLPWGPIRTVQALIANFGGGEDVTAVRSKQVYGVEQPHARWACPQC